MSLQLDISGLEGNTTFYVLFWLVWLLQLIVGNIVLMNFIIAVVSDVFATCMSLREVKILQLRLDMIAEYEQTFSKKELANEVYFP